MTVTRFHQGRPVPREATSFSANGGTIYFRDLIPAADGLPEYWTAWKPLSQYDVELCRMSNREKDDGNSRDGKV